MILEQLTAVMVPVCNDPYAQGDDVALELMRYMYMYIRHTKPVPNTHMHDVI